MIPYQNVHFSGPIGGVKVDRTSPLAKQILSRGQEIKHKPVSQYRQLVAKVAGDDSLTEKELDLLHDLANKLKFNPIDDFITDVETQRRYQSLEEECLDVDSRSADLETIAKQQREDFERYKQLSTEADLAMRKTVSEITRLSGFRGELMRIKQKNPRLFETGESA